MVWYEWNSAAVHRFYHADHQGSVVALADDTGNALAINGYDPWGIPNAGNQGRFGYTGQTWVPELGLWYYKARFYSPTTGRLLQVDPVGYKDQMNLYAYVGNEPVNRRDPTGAIQVGSCLPDSRGQIGASCSGISYIMGGSEGAGQGRGLYRTSQDRNTPEGQFVDRMFSDPEVRDSLNAAWRAARGDSGPTGAKKEWGFWVAVVGKDFRPGGLVRGDGPTIDRVDIDRARQQLPGAFVFVHVHPYRVGELRGINSVGISELDRGLALGLRTMVVSAGRPEPYTRSGVEVGWVDFYWGRPRQ